MAFNRKQKLRDNIEAIRTAFVLDREQRTSTAEERAILRKYCGFGGLKCILNPARELTDAALWAKSDLELFAPTVELHRLLRENNKDELEYKRYVDSLKGSVLTAFYTPKEITDAIADVMHAYHIRPGRVLEPSAGIGAFVDAVLDKNPEADVMAFEKDLLTGRILKHLHPGQKMRTEGFEKIEKPFLNHFDLAVSNIPFGDIAVFDAEFSTSKDFGRRNATKAIHNYFFLKGLDAVRDGGVVAFITSQGVLNAASDGSTRIEMLKHANFISAIRLPNNLFTDNAGTEVGSDLIVLQKNMGKDGLTETDRMITETGLLDGITTSRYFMDHPDRIIHTGAVLDTDPYGKPAMVYRHDGGIKGIAEELFLMLGKDLYAHHDVSLHFGTKEAKKVQAVPQKEEEVKPQAQPIEEKPEIEPRRPNHSSAVQLTLLDLWGMPIEEPVKKKKAAKKESKPKPMPSKPKPQVTTVPPVETTKPANGNKEEKQSDPDDIYATLDWETNPPINGFYETMMSLTPERRKALRLEAERHRQEQLKKLGIKDTLNPLLCLLWIMWIKSRSKRKK